MRKIIVLVAAIALVAGVVVYAKKRNTAACPCIQGSSCWPQCVWENK